MIYIGNIEILTAKSAIYLGNVGFRRIRPGVSVESAHRFGETAHLNRKLVGAGAEPWIYVMKVVGLVAKHRP